MLSPLATYVTSAPPGALRCASAKLKVPAPSAAVALLLAKLPKSQELSNFIWEAIMDAFEDDAALVTAVSALRRPRVLYTIDGPAEEKGKRWRVPFTAYLAELAE